MKIKIMAVDDEPEVLDLLKTMLETHGYEVLATDDSREALKRLEVEKVLGCSWMFVCPTWMVLS